jgi:hypothetical protein
MRQIIVISLLLPLLLFSLCKREKSFSPVQKPELPVKKPKVTDILQGKKLLGKWNDKKFNYKYALYQDKGRFLMETVYADGSVNVGFFVEKNIKGRAALFDEDEPNGYFCLEKDGTLGIYDMNSGFMHKMEIVK